MFMAERPASLTRLECLRVEDTGTIPHVKRESFLDRDWALLARAKAATGRELEELHGWTAAFERVEELGGWAAKVSRGKHDEEARAEELASHIRVFEAFDRLADRRGHATRAKVESSRRLKRGRRPLRIALS